MTGMGERFWAIKKRHGETGQPVLVFVSGVSDRGVARYVKPNPWVGKSPRDRRAGWTRPATCRVAELSTELMSLDREKIMAVVREIGPWDGGEA